MSRSVSRRTRDRNRKRSGEWRTVTGVWGKCVSCRNELPLHPDLRMCGTCTFGEADALMEFDGSWQEREEPRRRPRKRTEKHGRFH